MEGHNHMQRLTREQAIQHRSYRPEERSCPSCQSTLKRSHILWRKQLITLTGPVQVLSWGYRCPNAACATAAVVYRSAAAEGLHLRKHQLRRLCGLPRKPRGFAGTVEPSHARRLPARPASDGQRPPPGAETPSVPPSPSRLFRRAREPMGRRHRKIYKIGAGDALYVISAPTD